MLLRHTLRALTGLALLAVLALLVVLVAVPRFMGWVPLSILSGSMEPTIPTGSQVVVSPVVGEADAHELRVGDVITVMPRPNDSTLVTHRIVERRVTADGVSFVTQGDANGAPDEWDVTATQIRGLVEYHVPLAGYLATAVDGEQRAIGTLLAAAGLVTYAVVQLVGAGRTRRELDPEHAASAATGGTDAADAAPDAEVTVLKAREAVPSSSAHAA